MMLKMEHYEKGHRIASLAKSSETAEKMLGEGYQTALLQGQKLIFYPMDVENKEAWSIELTEEEARAAQETGEYSILEFQDHAAYVYYGCLCGGQCLIYYKSVQFQLHHVPGKQHSKKKKRNCQN